MLWDSDQPVDLILCCKHKEACDGGGDWWNNLVNQLWRIMAIGMHKWAHGA